MQHINCFLLFVHCVKYSETTKAIPPYLWNVTFELLYILSKKVGFCLGIEIRTEFLLDEDLKRGM